MRFASIFFSGCKLQTVIKLAVILLLIYSSGSFAEENNVVTFNEVWASALKNSSSLKAAKYEAKSAEIAGGRAGRHWFPRVFAQDRAFVTNDPAQVFMMNLGQRSIAQTDFMPDTLNNPGTEKFNVGTIGVDMPVYEGGSASLGARAMKEIAEAKLLEQELVRTKVYTGLARTYGAVLVASEKNSRILSLQQSISKILSRYQIGSRQNPVGYAGLLALKAVSKKTEILKATNDAKTASMKKYIEEQTQISISGKEFSGTFFEYTDVYLPRINVSSSSSFMLKGLEKAAEAQKYMSEAEKARFLPRLGLFTEANLYSGSRDTDTSYNAGFYLRMNIFSATDYGALDQAKFTSMAAKARADEEKVRGESELAGFITMHNTLESNIKLMNESMKIMDEQLASSLTLFGNGTITSLQLSDVYSNKADLIEALSRAEEEFLNTRAGMLFYADSALNFKRGNEK